MRVMRLTLRAIPLRISLPSRLNRARPAFPCSPLIHKGYLYPFTGGPFGSFVYLRADVAGVSGQGIPTGSVTFLDGGLPLVAGSSLMLNSDGNTATPNGILNFDTGTHTITASYSGDASFNPSITAQSQTFTI